MKLFHLMLVLLMFSFSLNPDFVAAQTIAELQATAEIGGNTHVGQAFVVQPGQRVTLRPILPKKQIKTTGTMRIKPFTLDSPQTIELNILWTARWKIPAGKVVDIGEHKLIWEAPKEPGNYVMDLILSNSQGFDNIPEALKPHLESGKMQRSISRFVMMVPYPFDRLGNGQIDGYPIGIYPNEMADDVKPYIATRRDRYHPPKYMLKVSRDVTNLKISKHFKLGDFVTDIQGDVFIALDYRLLERLEALIEEMHKDGHRNIKTLKIFRGYMSPNLIRRLRSQGARFTQWTRHMYGDAAAFMVDVNNDGVMDDLNHDGKIDRGDAAYIEEVNSRLEKETGKYGGFGVFSGQTDKSTPESPWVEIDMRGNRERW